MDTQKKKKKKKKKGKKKKSRFSAQCLWQPRMKSSRKVECNAHMHAHVNAYSQFIVVRPKGEIVFAVEQMRSSFHHWKWSLSEINLTTKKQNKKKNTITHISKPNPMQRHDSSIKHQSVLKENAPPPSSPSPWSFSTVERRKIPWTSKRETEKVI